MIKNRNNTAPILATIIIFCQNPVWLLWNKGVYWGYIAVFLLFLIKRKHIFHALTSPKVTIITILLAIPFIFIPIFQGMHFSNIFIWLSFLCAFTFSGKEMSTTLTYVTNTLALIICFSLPAWLIHTYILNFPLVSYLDLSEMKGSIYLMNNYVFFVTQKAYDYFRFYSVFDEPGVLGTLSALILLGNKYNFKNWQNFVILLGGIFTYSMAFYILSIIGYIYTNVKSFKKSITSIFFILIVIFGTYHFLKDDTTFQASVVERFNSKGTERLDNRTGFKATMYFNRHALDTNMIWGLGDNLIRQKDLREGQSYVLFILEYGWLGLAILFIAYLSLLKKYTPDTLFIVFWYSMSFLQRPKAFESWQIILFVCIINEILKRKTTSNARPI